MNPNDLDAIRDARRAPGPVLRKAPGPVAWFDVRRRRAGSVAFSISRLAGLGLVFYLYLHLAVLSLLLRGPGAWGSFLRVATTPALLGMDVLLLFGLLVHGLNGLRVALIGTGVAPDRQKALLWTVMTVAAILLLYGALHILGSR
ncbi:MAG: succinate dehydrogenase [Actinobacteria bacterium]|nr:succinate dehydrogenase [Actinomycetota bacterium]